MAESFGARLRRTREEQQIALATIAQQTKIKMSLLEGLERDDVSRWPSGIFRRAYIRTYGQAIGLDPDAVLREFLEVHPEPQELFEAALASALAADAARANGGSATRFRSLVGSALGSLTRLRRPSASDDFDAAPGVPDAFREVPPMAPQLEIVSATFLSQPPAEPAIDMADDAGVINEDACDPVEIEAAALPERVVPEFALDESPEETRQPAAPSTPDWSGVAELCTALGRVDTLEDLKMLLQHTAQLLHSSGLIVWIWDAGAERLQPVLAHGYSDRVLAHLPALQPESDNATAASFRTGQTCAIAATEHASGALAVPLQASNGPSGVLALELDAGRQASEDIRAAASIVAALLARLLDRPDPAAIEAEEKARAAEIEAREAEAQARAAEMEAFKSAVRRVHARR